MCLCKLSGVLKTARHRIPGLCCHLQTQPSTSGAPEPNADPDGMLVVVATVGFVGVVVVTVAVVFVDGLSISCWIADAR